MYHAGHFYFPTGGGSFKINLPFEPQGVALFGGNQATEDASITGGNPGVFFGMIWRTVGGGVDYQSQANTTFGVHWQNKPITCASSGTGVDYEASSASLDADGFTINVSTPAPGARLIHYLAWGEFEGANGACYQSTSSGQAFIETLPYRPFTAMMFSMFASGAVRNNRNGESNYFTMGVSNFPEDEDLNDSINNNKGAITFRTFTQMGSIGYTQTWGEFFDTMITPSVSSGLVGTFQTQFDHWEPWPTHLSNGSRTRLFGSHNVSAIQFWTGEGSSHFCAVPDTTSVVTARENIDEIEAAIFFGTTGYGEEQQLTPHVAYNFGVITKDYQGCVAFDTGIGDNPPATGTPSFYQSKQFCLADDIRSGGLRVASGELSGADLILTGEILTNPGHGSGFVQLFGPEVDHQQFFRRIQ